MITYVPAGFHPVPSSYANDVARQRDWRAAKRGLRLWSVVALLLIGLGKETFSAQAWKWVEVFGAQSTKTLYAYVFSRALAVDDEGCSYVTGEMVRQVNFDCLNLVLPGLPDNYGHPFLAKFNRDGDILWAKVITHEYDSNDESSGSGCGVALDAEGNVVITGYGYG